MSRIINNIALALTSTVLICTAALANTVTDKQTKKALSLYGQAEALFQLKDYSAAMPLYQKALDLHNKDEKILIREIINQHAVPFGRSARQATVNQSERLDYKPNQRLSFIKHFQEEQNRRAYPPVLDLKWITLRDPTHDNVLDGGETASIVLELINTGKSSAMEIKLASTADIHDELIFSGNQPIGTLAPGESRTVELKIEAGRAISGGLRNFFITAKEKTGFDSNTIDVSINTRVHQPESIIISEPVIQDFNGDLKIQPAEMIDVKARIKNTGKGSSQSLVATIIPGKNVYLEPGSKRINELGKIFPGEERTVTFAFLTNRRLRHNADIPIDLVLTDSQGNKVTDKRLHFRLHAPENRTRISLDPKPGVPTSIAPLNTVDVDTDIPARNASDPYAVAVIIGNKNYLTPGIPAVKYAHNDAAIIKQYAMQTLGIAENNILYLEDATSARFNEAFGTRENYAGWLYNFVEPGKSRVFIYYSGHGAPDIKSKSSWFVPTDTNPAYLSNSGYSLDTFYKNLAKLRAKNITVVLDTCFSGNSDGGFLFNNISPVYINALAPSPSLKNTAIFTSSEGNQVSTWYNEKRHGLFTYYFLKGLKGEADNNNDMQITTTELNDFIGKRLPFKARRINGNEQTSSLRQNREYVLVDYQHQKPPPVARAD